MHATIIDDEKVLSGLVKRKLESLHFLTTSFFSYRDFSKKDTGETDIYILDISLGDGHGFDVIRKVRKDDSTKNTPILLISGHDIISMKVEGLNLGADDYLVKPFDQEELIARVMSLLRRKDKQLEIGGLVYGDFIFDIQKRELTKNGVKIILIKKEKQFLELFLLSPGVLITKEDISKAVWNKPLTHILENNITVIICTLRKKLGPEFLLSTRVKEGYMLEEII